MVKLFFIVIFFLFSLPAYSTFFPIGPGPITSIESFSNSKDIFPQLTGYNLEGQKIKIAQDLEGEYKLLIVAFKRKQQEDINTWLSATEKLLETYPSLSVYELPTIKKMNFLIRFNINNGMRYGIDSKEQRLRTLTLYLDKEKFKSILDIETEDEIQSFLLDKNNKIIYRTTGLADNQKLQDIIDLISKK